MVKVGDLCIARRLLTRRTATWNGELCVVTQVTSMAGPVVGIKRISTGEEATAHVSRLEFLPEEGAAE